MESSKRPQRILDSKFILLEKIGSGATSDVYLAEDSYTNETVAVKILKQMTNSFENEVTTLTRINHDNVIKIKGYGIGPVKRLEEILNPPSNYLAMEIAPKGELFDYLYYPSSGLGEDFGRYFLKEMISGLQAIHNAGIAHRDIKLENIMLSQDYGIKIADFGFAKLIPNDGKFNTPLGTLSYAAPEILMKKPYDGVKADIFSLGAVLFTFITCKIGFNQATRMDKFYRFIYADRPNDYWRKLSQNIQDVLTLSNDFRDLFIKMISKEPDNRPTLEQILTHPWLTNQNINIITKAQFIEEFKNRDIIVNQQRQIEKMSNENINDEEDNEDNVYRGGKSNLQFNKSFIIKKLNYNIKGLNKNCIVINGKINPYRFMSKFFDELNDKKYPLIKSEKHLNFKLIFDADDNEEEEENNDDNNIESHEDDIDFVEKEQIIIKVSLLETNQQNQYVLLFDKRSGDIFEFAKKVQELKNIANKII